MPLNNFQYFLTKPQVRSYYVINDRKYSNNTDIKNTILFNLKRYQNR